MEEPTEGSHLHRLKTVENRQRKVLLSKYWHTLKLRSKTGENKTKKNFYGCFVHSEYKIKINLVYNFFFYKCSTSE